MTKSTVGVCITKTRPFNIQIFSAVKMENFSGKLLIFFLIFAQIYIARTCFPNWEVTDNSVAQRFTGVQCI